jgi:hypothetical protein
VGSASAATVDILEIITRPLELVQVTLNALDQLGSVRAMSIVKSLSVISRSKVSDY